MQIYFIKQRTKVQVGKTISNNIYIDMLGITFFIIKSLKLYMKNFVGKKHMFGLPIQ